MSNLKFWGVRLLIMWITVPRLNHLKSTYPKIMFKSKNLGRIKNQNLLILLKWRLRRKKDLLTLKMIKVKNRKYL
jgi:hypothetical protein